MNIINNQGETAIFHVNYENIVQVLLAAGVDVNCKNNQGETALFHVINAKIVNIFVTTGGGRCEYNSNQ